MTEKGYTKDGDRPKGNRAAAAAFTDEKEIKLIDFLRDNIMLYN